MLKIPQNKFRPLSVVVRPVVVQYANAGFSIELYEKLCHFLISSNYSNRYRWQVQTSTAIIDVHLFAFVLTGFAMSGFATTLLLPMCYDSIFIKYNFI